MGDFLLPARPNNFVAVGYFFTMNTNKKTALVTGASSGFGREIVKLFARDGYNVILVARSEGELHEVAQQLERDFAGCQTLVIPQDLSQSDGAQQLYDAVKQHGWSVHALVNDAGFGEHGLFVDTELERELAMIQLNVTSLVALTKLFMRDMVSRGEGRILQLASTVSFMPVPKLSVYAASKAFVLSFSEAVAYELKDTGVTMTALCPGASDTEFFVRADAEGANVTDTPLSDPAEVAKDGYDAMMKGETRVISGAMNKLQVYMSNFVPDSLLNAGMSKLMEK